MPFVRFVYRLPSMVVVQPEPLLPSFLQVGA